MEYTSEKSRVELDVIVFSPEEYTRFNDIFKEAINSRTPRIAKEYIKTIDRLILTDSLNSVEFIVKTQKENADYETDEEQGHKKIEDDYQTEKREKYAL